MNTRVSVSVVIALIAINCLPEIIRKHAPKLCFSELQSLWWPHATEMDRARKKCGENGRKEKRTDDSPLASFLSRKLFKLFTLYVCRLSTTQMSKASRPTGIVIFCRRSPNFGRSVNRIKINFRYKWSVRRLLHVFSHFFRSPSWMFFFLHSPQIKNDTKCVDEKRKKKTLRWQRQEKHTYTHSARRRLRRRIIRWKLHDWEIIITDAMWRERWWRWRWQCIQEKKLDILLPICHARGKTKSIILSLENTKQSLYIYTQIAFTSPKSY